MPQDPIPRVGSEAGRVLFNAIGHAASGMPVEDVMSACINMIANCIRQHYSTREAASARMTELYGRNMEVLLAHYDPTTGRRRTVVPFDQVISVSHVDNKSRVLGLGGRNGGP